MPVTVRFAPSPTGLMHVGNARIALVNWLFARAREGRFILRLDDTDRERSRPEYAAAIEEDLIWLGLDWDERFRQSDRLDRYRAAAERLKESGRLYPCYETAQELDLKRKHQLANHRPPVYDRAALRLSDAERARLEAEGRKPHWRFKLSQGRVVWNDLARHHPIEIDTATVSDPVLVREDGNFLYTLSSVVDDVEMGVTHIIRGEDHITNSAAQVEIIAALGGRVPDFAHLSLLADAEGKGLSKRLGALSLGELRAGGIEPMALNSLLAKLGSVDAVEPRLALGELRAEFDLAKFSHATPHFDPKELDRLNARLLHQTPFEAVRARLERAEIDERFWLAVRGNIGRVIEAEEWKHICSAKPIAPMADDADFARLAADLLPPEPWNETTWPAWTQAVKAATGRAGKALFKPLRLALTGREHGPEMAALLPFIGRTRALQRLKG
jgi:glutamyl-tRNA synthetase